MRTKQLTIRIPLDFHQQLVQYAENNYLPITRVVTQSVAKTIDYKHKKATPRTYTDLPLPLPVAIAPPVVIEEDYPDFTEEELADLQRRAANAPLKPMA